MSVCGFISLVGRGVAGVSTALRFVMVQIGVRRFVSRRRSVLVLAGLLGSVLSGTGII